MTRAEKKREEARAAILGHFIDTGEGVGISALCAMHPDTPTDRTMRKWLDHPDLSITYVISDGVYLPTREALRAAIILARDAAAAALR
jgi:hypothetical protein